MLELFLLPAVSCQQSGVWQLLNSLEIELSLLQPNKTVRDRGISYTHPEGREKQADVTKR